MLGTAPGTEQAVHKCPLSLRPEELSPLSNSFLCKTTVGPHLIDLELGHVTVTPLG